MNNGPLGDISDAWSALSGKVSAFFSFIDGSDYWYLFYLVVLLFIVLLYAIVRLIWRMRSLSEKISAIEAFAHDQAAQLAALRTRTLNFISETRTFSPAGLADITETETQKDGEQRVASSGDLQALQDLVREQAGRVETLQRSIKQLAEEMRTFQTATIEPIDDREDDQPFAALRDDIAWMREQMGVLDSGDDHRTNNSFL